jgi:hypothetical protein
MGGQIGLWTAFGKTTQNINIKKDTEIRSKLYVFGFAGWPPLV